MYRTMTSVVLLSALLGLPGGAADAAEPAFFNAEIRSLGTPAPDLERAFAALLERDHGPAWAAYTVPVVAGRQNLCCGGPALCSLERSGDCLVTRGDGDGDGGDGDGGGKLRVLLRIRDQRVTEVRAFSDDCRLDVGGLPIYVWEGVEARQSLDFLIERARAESEEGVAEGALVAVAHHGASEVDRLLDQVARGDLLPGLEEEAVFWLGEARGIGGFEVLARLRHEIRDTDVPPKGAKRNIVEHIAFALHLSEAPGALPELIDMARRDSSSDVRGTALFWLSQQAGAQATAAIAEAGEEDPDLEVKERAIFALSQLPSDRGVPLLIRYAQTHDSREIRKKAMFWLGQTEDSRAIDFFEEILAR